MEGAVEGGGGAGRKGGVGGAKLAVSKEVGRRRERAEEGGLSLIHI